MGQYSFWYFVIQLKPLKVVMWSFLTRSPKHIWSFTVSPTKSLLFGNVICFSRSQGDYINLQLVYISILSLTLLRPKFDYFDVWRLTLVNGLGLGLEAWQIEASMPTFTCFCKPAAFLTILHVSVNLPRFWLFYMFL
jgi:hypothetical protein